MSTTRTTTVNPDGTLNVKVTDTRTLEEKLQTLSFADRLEIMYPSNPVDVTLGWSKFDNHKRLK